VNRISTLNTPAELDLETGREELRDRRWQRRKSMLLVCAVLITVSSMSSDLSLRLSDFLRWL